VINIFRQPKRYFAIVARLSLVIAIGAATVSAYRVYNAHLKEEVSIQKTKGTMDCAAALSAELLNEIRVDSGNRPMYDVARLGCGFGIDGKSYLVRPEEIELHRAGKLIDTNAYPKIDLQENAFAALAYAILINFLGLVAFAAYAVFRWVWGRSATAVEKSNR
jgi:hypothetical protein